jgi:hypothetical protein
MLRPAAAKASPAGYIQADPVVAGDEAFPQESFFFLVMEG